MTTSLVVDASLTFRFFAPGDGHEYLRPLFEQWSKEDVSLVAPTLWVYEMTSIIAKAVYFDQLTDEEGKKLLQLAVSLDVSLVAPDEDMMRRAYSWTRRLHRAAAYDSFYLALAESLGCEFWTADFKLYNAADRSWVCLATDSS